MVKLSELADDAFIVTEAYGKVTVGDVKSEITEYGDNASRHEWYLPIEQKWYPSAEYMLSSYIENEEVNMYDGWYEKARDCITPQVIAQLQTVLDIAFSNAQVSEYWEFGKRVEIDIMPKASDSTEST